MWYLYKITNIIDGKVYIGQTVSPEIRWSRHKSNAKYNDELHLSKAIRKYGIENFNFEIIAQSKTLEGADDAEIWLINHYHSMDQKFGYNNSPGGQGKRPMSIETRMKLSKVLKGRVGTFTGKKHSNETKIKLSNANKGNKFRLGVKVSDNTKKLLSQINTGKKASEETRIKMSKSMIGKNAGKKNGMFGVTSEQASCAKLTLAQAIEIRKEYLLGNTSSIKLAKKYGVSKKTILNILHNKIYTEK